MYLSSGFVGLLDPLQRLNPPTSLISAENKDKIERRKGGIVKVYLFPNWRKNGNKIEGNIEELMLCLFPLSTGV